MVILTKYIVQTKGECMPSWVLIAMIWYGIAPSKYFVPKTVECGSQGAKENRVLDAAACRSSTFDLAQCSVFGSLVVLYKAPESV